MGRYAKWLKKKRFYFILLFLVASIAFWRCLPDPLFNTPLSTVMLDKDGKLLAARIAADDQWRFPSIESIPEKYKLAVISFEDKRFYSHFGVDPIAVARAISQNFSAGKTVSGASTITMQVIRLARGNPPRTLWQKGIEAVMALRLEISYSKDEILALYASNAPFGGNVIGLEAASWRYFGRAPKELSWAEAATLAVLPNSPALIHPGRNRDRLKAKRDFVLHSLTEQGHMTELDLKVALLEPLPEKPKRLPQFAPHLLDTLLKTNKSSARLRTTISLNTQKRVESIVDRYSQALIEFDINNMAVLVIDNTTFEVQAYVGNSDYLSTSRHAYALDIIHRPRSTGSILKPLLYARMIESGEILPTTLIPDLPTQYAGYMPENYDRQYRGAVPAKSALARSLNVPAVRMLKMHGVDRFYDFLKNAGISSLNFSPDHYGLTLILGGAEASLWDVSNIYANLAYSAKQTNSDYHAKYFNIKVLATDSIETDRFSQIGPASAWLTIDALVDVSRPGQDNYWREFSSSRKIAWKTGTSYGLRDAWAIGNDTRYTVAVWVGNASGEGKPGLTGVNAAAPVMFEVFNQLEKADTWFQAPLALMKPVEVCIKDGYLANADCESETLWIPKESHFQKSSPHHIYVHMDKTGEWRVHSKCENVVNMRHKSWFVLPPGQAFYYRQQHAEYRPLPQYRADCRAKVAELNHQAPIEIIYPSKGTKVYIPIDLDEQKSKTVFKAVHLETDAVLFWHLDDQFIAQTKNFHEIAVDVAPGNHRLTLVDQNGFRKTRRFKVLGK